MAKHSSHIVELARRGAVLMLRELANELSILLSAFRIFTTRSMPTSCQCRSS